VLLPGTYDCRNLGDLAMLLVALERLKARWPTCQITILAYEAEPFARFCPGLDVSPLQARDTWLGTNPLPLRGHAGQSFDQFLRGRFPRLRRRLFKVRQPADIARALDSFISLVEGADLLLMTGCGGVNDTFKPNALRILETFELAMRSGLRTAMVGQGLGPMHDPEVAALARRVLPRVDLIALRDGNSSLPLLLSLGVDERRVQVTGDDAVELAYRERTSALGTHIGVNLRVADYSGINAATLTHFGEVLNTTATRLGVRLLGLPISLYPTQSDSKELSGVFTGADGTYEGGQTLETPRDVILRARECRVVVAVSYHAAVFALSMGIPTIGIVQSDYYQQKFAGLADLFGSGCEVVLAGEPDFSRRLEAAFARLWTQAPVLRERLLTAARSQVEKGRLAYHTLFETCQGLDGFQSSK
jgi:colanic acid/amylovoran biosynthesis protein